MANTVLAKSCGTVSGSFNPASEIIMLIANVVASFLRDKLGESVTFYTEAGFGVMPLIGVVLHPATQQARV